MLLDVEEIIGIERRKGGAIVGEAVTGEDRTLQGDAIVSMNLWGFTPQHFAQLEAQFIKFLQEHGTEPKSECYIPTVVDQLIAAGEAVCHVLPTTSSWFGVTYPDDKPRVMESIEKLIQSGEYPRSLH